MKLNRIISTVLALVLVFGSVAAFLPVKADAAYSPSISDTENLSDEQIKEIVLAATEYDFASAEEALNYELERGYLESVNSDGNEFTLYVNRYTGVIYYRNNLTGEILTSNPYNVGYKKGSQFAINDVKSRKAILDQITISFTKVTESSATTIFGSTEEGAERAQIQLVSIRGGFRVSYTLGDTAPRKLAPKQLTVKNFEELLLKPMFEYFADFLEERIGEHYPDQEFNFFEAEKWGKNSTYKNGAISEMAYREYSSQMEKLYGKVYAKNSIEYLTIASVFSEIDGFKSKYSIFNPEGASQTQIDKWVAAGAPAVKDGVAVAFYIGETAVHAESVAKAIRTYCPEYSFQDMYDDEAAVGVEIKVEQTPVFRCALEYTFNKDGSLSVRLPANSISFDESTYILKEIASLSYFGAGDLSREGYIFVPDGSGSIIEFEDFYAPERNETPTISPNLSIYGEDYCKSFLNLSGAHREQVTMPVYGVVSTTTAGALTSTLASDSSVKTGYFAILESGASLAKLQVKFGGNSNKYGNVYSAFSPYPSDTYKLSDTISVGGSGEYTKVSESKYTGSYVTRYVMLSDTRVGLKSGAKFTPASYVGMATYYRNYLKENGELTALENVAEDLPLYIEALGSMEIIKKILTFPVTTSIPLTEFADVEKMYDDFAAARDKLLAKHNEYKALAEAEEDSLELKRNYEEKAAHYYSLYENVDNITNVNFRLTGFANGGMYFTYPTKVKWEKACGGKDGFRALLASANEKKFSVYPEFDFQYISNTAMFDGISNKNTVSTMVDNRYASKQAYNSVIVEYESIFAMVISPDALDRLYSKFIKKYSEFGVGSISVSTLGSDLNSNFDKDNPINREESSEYVRNLLDRISKDNKIMLDKGNIYTVKYADHILNISTDSSHLRDSSYTIPFTGMVLHGYVNYAGKPLNYSGSPKYDMLRAIENGASLYYLLCYQNTNYMKDDQSLSKYYGVNYETWFERVVEHYDTLNGYIGDLQSYEIVDHTTLIAERIIDSGEVAVNRRLLMNEFLEMVSAQLDVKINEAFDSMFGDDGNIGKGLKVVVNVNSLLQQAAEEIMVSKELLLELGFDKELNALKAAYEAAYPGKTDGQGNVTSTVLNFGAVVYDTKYEYVTDSFSDDWDNYVYTDYTIDNNSVAMVTYKDAKTGDVVRFILNYNIYSVKVTLSTGETVELEKYGVAKIDLRGA